jgi:hypothetical protein
MNDPKVHRLSWSPQNSFVLKGNVNPVFLPLSFKYPPGNLVENRGKSVNKAILCPFTNFLLVYPIYADGLTWIQYSGLIK